MSDDIPTRLAGVRARFTAACARAGRRVDEVTLLAASKYQPDDAVRAAYAAGHRVFGENHAQALRDRVASCADLTDAVWHAIGPLQTKNVKYVARAASVFHALDRVEVADELSRRREGPPIDVFLEVNVGGEESKHGVAPADVVALRDAVVKLPNLRVVGLMSMPPMPDGFVPEDSRPYFRELRALAHGLGLGQLSMGTTEDFEVAIEEGATAVRVGRSIFGERLSQP